MTRLNNGRYQIATSGEVRAFIKEASGMVEKYGWQDRTVMPYSYPEKVTKIINELRDYDRCTHGSKLYLIALANGLAEIMEAWERHELEPKMTVRSKKTGKIVEISLEVARELIEDGYVEAV